MVENNVGINKLRLCKNKLRKLNRIINFYYKDNDITEPETLKELLLISEIDTLITDVIYYIIDNEITIKS